MIFVIVPCSGIMNFAPAGMVVFALEASSLLDLTGQGQERMHGR
jgi:hypothetical protein